MQILNCLSKTRILALFFMLFISNLVIGINITNHKHNFTEITEQQEDTIFFQVAYDEDGPWLSNISIKKEERLSLWYRIVLDGETEEIKVIFPIYITGDTLSRPKSMAMMTIADWNRVTMKVKNLDTDDVDKGKRGDVKVYGLKTKTEIIFQLEGKLKDPESLMSDGATCVFRKKDGSESKVTLTKNEGDPFIASFTAEKSVLISGEKPKFSWDVVDAKKIKIYETNTDKARVERTEPQSFWTEDEGVNNDTYYTLKAFVSDKEGDSKKIPIKSFKSSQIASQASPFENKKIMGFYKHPMDADKMIALIRDKSNVLIWESDDGLAWQKLIADNRYIAFQDSISINTVNVPLEFAGSPGVVFNKRLYLIGGSRFDPNMRSNEVYFYDFTNKIKGWQKLEENAGFTPRMGHSCVVYNNEIWVMGGSDKNGARDDCWIFSKDNWEPGAKLPRKKCMASALVIQSKDDIKDKKPGIIQVFGGFGDLPGVPDQTLKESYTFESGSWKSIDWKNSVSDEKYSASSSFLSKGNAFLLSRKKINSKYAKELEMIIVKNSVEDAGISLTDIELSDSFCTVQTLAFKDVVWLCITAQNGNETKDSYLRYFVNAIKN